MTPFLFAVKLLFTLVTFPRCLVAGVLVDLALANLAPCKPSSIPLVQLARSTSR